MGCWIAGVHMGCTKHENCASPNHQSHNPGNRSVAFLFIRQPHIVEALVRVKFTGNIIIVLALISPQYPHLLSIGAQLDPAIAVGAQDSIALQQLEHL